jgi:hypothetical protein
LLVKKCAKMDSEDKVDTETEAIIKSALEEQQYEKRARKEGQPKKGTALV